MKIQTILSVFLFFLPIVAMKKQETNLSINKILVKPAAASLKLAAAWAIVTNKIAIQPHKIPAEILEFINQIESIIITSNITIKEKKFLVNLINNPDVEVLKYFLSLLKKYKTHILKQDISNKQIILDGILLKSVSVGSKELTVIALNFGANINTQDNYGNTALIYTAMKGYNEIAKLLIDNHASVNHKNYRGHTPLMFAVINNHKNMTKLLIGAQANISDQDKYGNTALNFSNSHEHQEISAMLLDCNAQLYN